MSLIYHQIFFFILNEYRRWPIATSVSPFNLISAQEKHEVKRLSPHFFHICPTYKLSHVLPLL